MGAGVDWEDEQALDADQIARMERENSASDMVGSSVWNKGGTWEEKVGAHWLPLMSVFRV